MKLVNVNFVNVDCVDWYGELAKFNKSYRRFFPRKIKENKRPLVTLDYEFENGTVRHTYKVAHMCHRNNEPVLVIENGLGSIMYIEFKDGLVKSDLVENINENIKDEAKRYGTDYETIVKVFYL